jgi:hypothetical protein
MPDRDGTFACCISLLMLNFLPDYRWGARKREVSQLTMLASEV